MNTNHSPSLKITLGMEVLSPKTEKAYPISCDEWNYLKENISLIPTKPNVYYTIGTLLFGASITILITIFTSNFLKFYYIIIWVIFVTTFLFSVMTLFYAFDKTKTNRTNSLNIIDYMNLIEKRYQTKIGDV